MSALYGADVAQLRALGQQFDQAADRLDSGRLTVGNAIRISAWVGPYATSFRLQWDSQHSRYLHAAAASLRDAARVLRANAEQQESASAASGGGSASTQPSPLQAKWEAMTAAQRAALSPTTLEVYGSDDALPASVRDEANRDLLTDYLARPCPTHPQSAVDRYRVYEQVASVLHGHPDAQLLVFDPDGGTQPHVAISLGDVDTAKNVAVYVQGYDSRADKPSGDGVTAPVQAVGDLRAQMTAELRSEGRGDESTATVIWMGYDAPPSDGEGIANALAKQYGEAGAPVLASFADGIRAQNPDAHLVAYGHSYGSYVVGLAAQRTDAFDAMVVAGSPGLGTHDLSDLRVNGNLTVIADPTDPIVASSATDWFSDNPATISGAHVEHVVDHPARAIAEVVGGAVVAGPLGGVLGVIVDGTRAHGEYLQNGSASQQLIAQAIVR